MMPHANHPTHQCVSPWNTADPHRLHLCNEFLARDTSGVLGCFRRLFPRSRRAYLLSNTRSLLWWGFGDTDLSVGCPSVTAN
ncbi:hypothetical protein I553_1417 [Mycobacterium xenopi 4042]|uniref:Uncharacterized protein n=1 Tax=Mycobacterium xenopi 4042 TaxID=1299334 RepID=X8CGA9_MYCXE|nr:hypothetical protein I553_1417 [Mycobacterium xenopi 4042]